MKTITKIFLVVGALFLVFIVWSLVFNNGGVLQIAYTAIEKLINTGWTTLTGSSSPLLPAWNATGNTPTTVGGGAGF